MKEKKHTILSFFPMTKGYRTGFILSFFAIILSVLLSYLVPQVIRVTVDSILGEEPLALPNFFIQIIEGIGGKNFFLEYFMWIGVVMVILAIASAICDFYSRYFLAKSCEGTIEKIRNELYRHIQILPYQWHNLHQTGDIIQRCTMDTEVIKGFVNNQLQALIRTIFLIIIALALMFPMSIKLAFIALAFLPITLITASMFYKIIGNKYQIADECEGELTSIVQENLTGVRVVRAFGREQFELEKFNKQNKIYTDTWINLSKIMGYNWGTADFISGLQIVLVIIFGTILSVQGELTLGEFLTFVSYNFMLVWPVRELGKIIAELSKTSISATRLFDILDAEPEKDKECISTTSMNGDIKFNNVSFSYDGIHNVIHNIQFDIKGGQTLGILGSTGSGKSTLIYLLARLYELPKENGSITIGGVDIRDMALKELRSNIGIVLQEPFLFSKSFQDTIADGSKIVDIDEVRRYAKLAVIDHTIMNFREGYATKLGERGVTISGGQKQRVAIARMLMQDTHIKIFDDSLSAVDMETDAKIRAAIEHQVEGTTMIIAHRITTIMNADKIIVMDKGKIVQEGTHQSLVREEGIYQQIYQAQNNDHESR